MCCAFAQFTHSLALNNSLHLGFRFDILFAGHSQNGASAKEFSGKNIRSVFLGNVSRERGRGVF
jgi:hypothetical protein